MTDKVKKAQNVTKDRVLLPAIRKSDLVRAFPESPDYLTKDEAHKLIAVMKRERDRLLFLTLWTTGLRISEALSLTLGSIRDNNLIVTRKGGKVLTVVIPEDTLNRILTYAVREHIEYQDRLFPITRTQAWRLLQRYATLAGLERKVKNHLFRHGFAVNILKQVPNLVAIQQQLGHSSIETTRKYLRIILPDVKEVLEKVEF